MVDVEFHDVISCCRVSQRGNRTDNLLSAHYGVGIVRHIAVERGVHHLIRIICRSVSRHCDPIAKLSCVANGCFDAGMRYQPDHDELMNAMLFELQIQVRVGEAAGVPMFLRYNLV